MNIFKKLFRSSEEDEPLMIPHDEDDDGKHVVRIMVGNRELVLLLTDIEFIRAADRARRQLSEMAIEDVDAASPKEQGE